MDGARARVGVIEPPEPPVSAAQTDAELAGYRRQQARQRCTFVLRLLAAAAVSTGILGALPEFRLAWIFTGITGIAALALAGLFAYARSSKDNGRPSPSRVGRTGDGRRGRRPAPDVVIRAAQAGFPGAWDEDEDIDVGIEAPVPSQRRTATGG